MTEIRSGDCVQAIMKVRPGSTQWKRRQKYRIDPSSILSRAETHLSLPHGYYRKKYGEDALGIVREFTNNSVPDVTAFVIAVGQNIFSTRVLTPKGGVQSYFEKDDPTSGRGDDWRFKSDVIDGEDIKPEEVWKAAYIPIILGNVSLDYATLAMGIEELDFENYEVRAIRDTEVDIWHGGDWQEPHKITYRHMSDGLFYPVCCQWPFKAESTT